MAKRTLQDTVNDATQLLNKDPAGIRDGKTIEAPQVETDFRSLDSGSGGSQTNGVNDALGGFVEDNQEFDSKSILEKFADRKTLAEEGGEASRKLIESDASEDISSQLETNSRNFASAVEGRSMGTKTAAVKFLEESGSKRVRQLEKDRDSLLLQSKVLEAQRLDNLIIEEQSAITTGRKAWLDSILAIGQERRAEGVESRAVAAEERAARGFETPAETRLAEEEQAIEGTVRELALLAPDVGIASTDTFDDAVQKYRNSTVYKNDQRAGELQIQQAEANLNKTYVATQKIISDQEGVTVSDEEITDLDFVAGNVVNLIASENGKEAYRETLANARTPQEKMDVISATVLANSSSALQEDFRKMTAGAGEIDQAIRLLEEGVQTGVLEAGVQAGFDLFGGEFDEGMSAIAAHITSAVQPYRSSITGAAWGSQEDKEYKQLFGATKYEPEVLLNKLKRMKGIMQRGTINAISAQVSPFGQTRVFDDVFQPAGIADTFASGGGSGQNIFSDDDI